MGDYWQDRCPRCGHARGFHGEGGCTSTRRSWFGIALTDGPCRCSVGQSAIPRAQSGSRERAT